MERKYKTYKLLNHCSVYGNSVLDHSMTWCKAREIGWGVPVHFHKTTHWNFSPRWSLSVKLVHVYLVLTWNKYSLLVSCIRDVVSQTLDMIRYTLLHPCSKDDLRIALQLVLVLRSLLIITFRFWVTSVISRIGWTLYTIPKISR